MVTEKGADTNTILGEIVIVIQTDLDMNHRSGMSPALTLGRSVVRIVTHRVALRGTILFLTRVPGGGGDARHQGIEEDRTALHNSSQILPTMHKKRYKEHKRP